MAIETVRVGSFNNDAIFLEYDYETTDNRVHTIRYKNADGLSARLTIYNEPEHTVLFTHGLPPNAPEVRTRNIPAGQRPVYNSDTMSIAFDTGGFAAQGR
jgi:hypothetical protein